MTVTDAPATAPVIGTRMLRREDPALLTGEARFTDDLDIPGALHMAILRSPYAHARITSIDVQPAPRCPASSPPTPAPTSTDAWANPMPCAWPVTEDMKNPPHYPLAVDKVCYVGDGVAVVLAESPQRRPRRARGRRRRLRPAAGGHRPGGRARRPTVIHEDLGTNTSYTWELHLDDDAVERAFADAAHVVKERYVQQRLIPMAWSRGPARPCPSPSAATSRSTRPPRSPTSSR